MGAESAIWTRIRKQVRHYVKDILKDATRAGKNVFPGRVLPIDEEFEVPAIYIYSNSENSEIFNQAPRDYKKTLTLKIELLVFAKDEENIDDYLDDFSAEVESLMARDHRLGDLVSTSVLSSTETEVKPDGKILMGSTVLTYDVEYLEESPKLDDLIEELPDFDGLNYTLKPQEALPSTPSMQGEIDANND